MGAKPSSWREPLAVSITNPCGLKQVNYLSNQSGAAAHGLHDAGAPCGQRNGVEIISAYRSLRSERNMSLFIPASYACGLDSSALRSAAERAAGKASATPAVNDIEIDNSLRHSRLFRRHQKPLELFNPPPMCQNACLTPVMRAAGPQNHWFQNHGDFVSHVNPHFIPIQFAPSSRSASESESESESKGRAWDLVMSGRMCTVLPLIPWAGRNDTDPDSDPDSDRSRK
jgi:hypothetical protein